MKPRSIARNLGEVALRVRNLDAMQAFYEDVIGLEVMKRFPHATCFRIAEGFAGHTQVLFLFDRSGNAGYIAPESDRTTVDHIAFAIALEDFDGEKTRLEALGCAVETMEHPWVQWRSLYVHDPEGNSVELVAFDPSIARPTE